jgi:hypothetical protein
MNSEYNKLKIEVLERLVKMDDIVRKQAELFKVPSAISPGLKGQCVMFHDDCQHMTKVNDGFCKCVLSNIVISNNQCTSYEKKQPEKSTEEQVFELIKDEDRTMINNLFDDTFDSFKRLICHEGVYVIPKTMLFLAIMKGVHELIQGDREYKNREDNCFIIYNTDFKGYTIVSGSTIKYHPSFFYFSSTENAEKARDILSSFFKVNILDWWYKS